MSELDELILNLDREDENENDSSFVTAVEDASWMGEMISEEGDGRSNISHKKTQRINEASDKSVGSSVEVFDKFFGIRIRNPKISSTTFNAFVEGMQKICPGDLKANSVPSGDWVTLGVVSTKSDIRKTSNNSSYMFIMVVDLTSCQSHPIKILMFGDCVKEHWKVQVSTAVALLSPAFFAGTVSKATNVTLKVTKPNQILCLGICPDFAFCKGKKMNGENCRNFVNRSISEYCVFHIESYSRKFASRRGAFNSTSFVPPKRWIGTSASNVTGSKTFSIQQCQPHYSKLCSKLLTVEKVHKSQKVNSSSKSLPSLRKESAKLSEVLRIRADSLGAKNLAKHLSKHQKDEKQNKCGLQKLKSFKDFFSNKENDEDDLSVRKPCLGRGFNSGEIVLWSPTKKRSVHQVTSSNDRKRALEVLQRRSEKNVDGKDPLPKKAAKRVADLNNPTSSGLLKKPKIDDEVIRNILKKESTHERELLKDDQNLENKYFNIMEEKEKVETFVTSIMEVKECSVVTCKKCNYTAQKQSNYCKINGHLIVHHKANKRFFKCCNCSKRVVCYELLPTRPCPNCGEKEYERVAMRDERNVPTLADKLLIRGEEVKFVNR